jgi:hypothetical protein
VSDDREENEMRNYGNHTELNVSYSLSYQEIDALITIFIEITTKESNCVFDHLESCKTIIPDVPKQSTMS